MAILPSVSIAVLWLMSVYVWISNTQPTITSDSSQEMCSGIGLNSFKIETISNEMSHQKDVFTKVKAVIDELEVNTGILRKDIGGVNGTCRATSGSVQGIRSDIDKALIQYGELQTNLSVFQAQTEQMLKGITRDVEVIKEQLSQILKNNSHSNDDAGEDRPCPAGFTYSSRAASCFHLGAEAVTWAQAADNCSLMSNSTVVSVRTAAEMIGLRQFLHSKQLNAPVSNVSSLSGPQTAALIREGSRVTRGPDWSWGEQDGGTSLGTVVTVGSATSWTRVFWDMGHSNNYRMALNGKYDLSFAFTEMEYLVWTSGRRTDGDINQWQWPGERTVTYFDWFPAQPDNAGRVERCLQLIYSPCRNALKMNDYFCHAKSKYVCQVRI